MIKEINKVNIIKQKQDAFLYINSLFNLFSNILNMNFIELFINYLNEPKIIVDNNKDDNNEKNTYLRVKKDEIKKFNNLFSINSNKDIYDINNKININENDDNKESENEEVESEENESEEDENNKGFQNDNIKYENYNIIINNEIIKKLFELYKNNNFHNSKVIFYEKLNAGTNKFYNDLKKFMNDYKLM